MSSIGPQISHEDNLEEKERSSTPSYGDYKIKAVIDHDVDDGLPTAEERATLRLVSAKVPWVAYAIAFVEFAERASYYGCTGVFNNFIQRPLPKGGNGAGATPVGTQLTPGALGLGLQTATAITTAFNFVAYVIPVLGGIVADTKWGRFKTICFGAAFGIVAHVVLLVAGVPSVIQGKQAIIPFAISLIILAFATGFIKASVAPFMADQANVKSQRVTTLKSGERVIVDPDVTVQNVMHIFYWSINVGAFLRLGTTYAEKRIGFWLAYLVPLIIYLFLPIVLVATYRSLVKMPPQGSVVLDTFKVGKIVLARGGLSGAMKGGDEFWKVAKPSLYNNSVGTRKNKSGWVKWDEDFVDEVRRTITACKIFAFLPVFYLADSGLSTIQTSMAGSMTTNGAPNDLLSNFNPLTIIVVVPILNYLIYPYLRKIGINFTSVRRIITGFVLGALTMAVGAILQWRVYQTSPCGYFATNCKIGTTVSPLSVWAQIPLYSLPAIGELMVLIPCYELAYTHAPLRMKGLVFSMVLFTNAISSAIILIVTPSFKDPRLIWPFVGIGAANISAAFLIWCFFRAVDRKGSDVVAIGTNRQTDSET